ncbi:alpha-L-fucosidase [Saccharopolyspora spinosporotrichia]
MAKAVDVVPAPKQIAWQQQGVIAFTHFGMNTFTDREWGSGAEDPASFDPPGLDVEQWMRAYRDSGAKLVMLTVKHHDGFVLYPTRYTRHSIVASPWWNGDPSRDVLGRYVRAAREAGLRVGIYLALRRCRAPARLARRLRPRHPRQARGRAAAEHRGAGHPGGRRPRTRRPRPLRQRQRGRAAHDPDAGAG